MKKLLKFFVYLKPTIWYLVLAIFAGLIFGISSGFGMPLIFDKVLREIFMQQGTDSEYTMWQVVGIAALLPALFAIRAVSGYVSGFLMAYCSLEVLRRLKVDLFQKTQSYPMAFFDKYTTGDLLTRLTNDTSAVQSILLSFSSEIFRQPLQVVGALGFLVFMCVTKGEVAVLLIFFAAVPFCILPVQLIRKNLKTAAREAQGGLSKIAQTFGENLDAVHEVRVFGLQEKQTVKFGGLNKYFTSLSLKISKYELMQQPFMEFLSALMVAITFVYAYYSHIDFPTFAAIGVALYFTIDPIKRVIRMVTDFIKTLPLMDRLIAILEYESTVPDPANPVVLKNVKGTLKFGDVSFSYNDKTVLKNASIIIPAGTSCALVGESGAGKSTFAKLAMRLYDPISGVITMDGVNLKDVTHKNFVEFLGSVPQYPVLFNDTVFNNIALAKDGASKEEVFAAAKAAYADDFIKTLENGYDTMVGERGDRLSGGQKQRIALARVFLKNPPFIVLDEATSALDVNSEAFIQKAIDELMKDRTMLIIAHRFSTIRNVQKIIVFHEGQIADYGTHDELYGRCSHYKHLYDRQASKIS